MQIILEIDDEDYRTVYVDLNDRCVYCEQQYGCPLIECLANLYNIDRAQLTKDSVTENDYDRKELYRVLNSLPDNYRIPFSMFVSGFKYREIADKLSLPLGTVTSRIFLTRHSLQEELKDFLL